MVGRDREIDRETIEKLLTTVSRALCGIYKEGKVKRSKVKKYAGSQYAYAIYQLVRLGLAYEHEDFIELSERGRALAECFCKCFY